MNSDRRVTGIGGIFFKSAQPMRLAAWYRDHLGIELEAQPAEASESEQATPISATFQWRRIDDPERRGMTVWAVFAEQSDYFSPAPFMVNYRVDDLDAVLDALRSEGVWVDDHREEYDYGRFAWIKDPDGNRIELWEPLGE